MPGNSVNLPRVCAKVNSAPYILIYLEFHSSKDQPTTKHNIRYSVQVRIGQRMVEIHERQARGGQRAALRSPLQLATHRPMRRRAQSPPPRPWAPPRRLPPCAHLNGRVRARVRVGARFTRRLKVRGLGSGMGLGLVRVRILFTVAPAARPPSRPARGAAGVVDARA